MEIFTKIKRKVLFSAKSKQLLAYFEPHLNLIKSQKRPFSKTKDYVQFSKKEINAKKSELFERRVIKKKLLHKYVVTARWHMATTAAYRLCQVCQATTKSWSILNKNEILLWKLTMLKTVLKLFFRFSQNYKSLLLVKIIYEAKFRDFV